MIYATGIFLVDYPIKLTNNVCIRGDGIDKTILILNDPYNKDNSSLITADSVHNICISDLTINMNFLFPTTATNIKSTPVINISNSSRITLKNVRIINSYTNNIDSASDCIQLVECNRVKIINCIFDKIGGCAIFINGTISKLFISCNHISNTGNDAIRLKNCKRFEISNNFIYKIGGRGVNLLGISNGNVAKNYINMIQCSGISLSNFNANVQCTNISICDNKLANIGFFQHPLCNNNYINNNFNMIQIEKLKENDCDLPFSDIIIRNNCFYNSKGKIVCIVNLHPKIGIGKIYFCNNIYETRNNLLIDIIHPECNFDTINWWTITNSVYNK